MRKSNTLGKERSVSERKEMKRVEVLHDVEEHNRKSYHAESAFRSRINDISHSKFISP